MIFYVGRLLFLLLVPFNALLVSPYPWLEQISRQEQLGSACKNIKTKAKLKVADLDHILVDHQHKMLYCYVPKVACTNWKRVLIALTGNLQLSNLVEIPSTVAHAENATLKLSQLPKNEINHCLNEYTTFLMVRHPFERLLSAYRNKFVDNLNSSKYFQGRYGRHIIEKYRKGALKSEIDTGQNVTFREFVKYLLSEGVHTNEHWTPIYDLCHPCTLNYTFIGYYETLLEDSKTLLEMIGAPVLNFPMTRQGGTKDKMRQYFQELSIYEIQQLYILYDRDFRLFGYGVEDLVGYDLA